MNDVNGYIKIMIDPGRESSWLMIVDGGCVVNDAKESNDYIMTEIALYKLSEPDVVVGTGCDLVAGRIFQVCVDNGIEFHRKDKYELLDNILKVRAQLTQ